MTTTYDPRDRLYTDEYDVRLEVARVFDVCTSCRKCVSLCPTFPALISSVESKPGADAGRLTPDEQDDVVAECFRCSLCVSSCPYTPDLHDAKVDFPRLVDRYRAMQKAQKKWSLRSTLGHAVIGRSTSIVRLIVRCHPDGFVRRLLARTAGISRRYGNGESDRVQLSSWVGSRRQFSTSIKGHVALFPTCVVEVVTPDAVQQLVDDYDQNGVECSLVGAGLCCGAPALIHGEMKFFSKNATRVIEKMTEVIRQGTDIVVVDPRCSAVIVRDYPHYVNTEQSRTLAAHVSATGVSTAGESVPHAWWGLHLEHPSLSPEVDADFAKKPPTD